MKLGFNWAMLVVGAMVVGCSTPDRVATSEGEGTRKVYAANADAVWRAVIDAAQQQGLEVHHADKPRGYVDARRGVRMHTFGENVGIFVSSVGPDTTSVEVVSRQAGPPVAWLKNWENEIHRAITANLTREVPSAGNAPRNTYIDPQVTQPERIPDSRILPPNR